MQIPPREVLVAVAVLKQPVQAGNPTAERTTSRRGEKSGGGRGGESLPGLVSLWFKGHVNHSILALQAEVELT